MTKQEFLNCKPFQYDIGDFVYAYDGSGNILRKSWDDGFFYHYCKIDRVTNTFFECTIEMFGMPHVFVMMYKRCST